MIEPALPTFGPEGASAAPSTASQILEALKARSGNCIWATELAFTGGARRCDFWQLEVHASKGFRATAFEIKVSRADFRRDSHEKQRESRLFSDRFYYTAPTGLLRKDEIPDWAGLLEWNGKNLTKVLEAPHRDKDAPSWELVVSLIRNSGEVRRETDILTHRINAMRRYQKVLQDQLSAQQTEIGRLYRELAAKEAK